MARAIDFRSYAFFGPTVGQDIPEPRLTRGNVEDALIEDGMYRALLAHDRGGIARVTHGFVAEVLAFTVDQDAAFFICGPGQ